MPEYRFDAVLTRAKLQAAPFYRIFAADARAPRDGKHIDVVGHFDPIPGQLA